MKTALTLGLGFWLGRQVYERYHTGKAQKKYAKQKTRLTSYLETYDLEAGEIKQQVQQILG
jgi:hypothetical protein